MATPTYTELLDAAKTALLDIYQNGQHVGKDGRIYTKADVNKLKDQIDWLEPKAASESSSSLSNILDRSFTIAPYRGA